MVGKHLSTKHELLEVKNCGGTRQLNGARERSSVNRTNSTVTETHTKLQDIYTLHGKLPFQRAN